MTRGLVMGVLNVTPDSFSDGGHFLAPADAVAHGLALVAAGADIVDVGGESTRPGAVPVAPEVECARVLPVVEALAPHVRVSIDTRSAEVARAAVAAGATLVNDVSASLHEVAAELGVGWIAVHMQGEPATMQADPRYDDVVAEVRAFLVERAAAARAAGVQEVWIDPGIGFGKTTAHNLAILGALDRFVGTGIPVVVGASRKRFVGELHARSDTRTPDGPVEPVAAGDRREGSVAIATWAFAQGVGMVRAHDVRPTAQAAAVVAS
jgi:dihydropteroate synthase